MEHFFIFYKKVGNNVNQTYYKSFKNAQEALLENIERVKQMGWKVINHLDEWNEAKGIHNYEYELLTDDFEKVKMSILDGYFMD